MSHRTSIAVVVAAVVVTAAVGPAAASPTRQARTDVALNGEIDSSEEAVLFAHTVDEVKGHLRASTRLAGDRQPEEAAFHACHAFTDYWTEGSARGPLERARADNLFTELQASASQQASPSEPTAITADLRSTLSDDGTESGDLDRLFELFVDLVDELLGTTALDSN